MDSTFFHYVARVESMVKVSFETVFRKIFGAVTFWTAYVKKHEAGTYPKGI